MSDTILIKSKAIPSNPRSKNYPAGATVIRSGGGGDTTVVTGGGSSIDILKVDDLRSLTDRNVFSSLRTIFEITSRIILSSDTEAKLTDDKFLSALRANEDLKKAVDSIKNICLRKDQEDKTDYLLKLLGGIITDNIESQNFISGPLGTGFLINRNPTTGKSYIEVDELYVRLKAIFESLSIKELQSVGGEILLTIASIECTKVEALTDVALYDSSGARLYDSDGKALYVLLPGPVYRCYFTADDGEKAIINQFAAGDLAQCRQFNIKEGAYEGISNRYYWRHIVSVGENYIDLSIDDCDEGSDIPQAGDKIIQLGNRTDPARQNAILLSAYGNAAPTIQMLQGIDSYSLDGKAVKDEGFDRDSNEFYSNNYGRNYVGARDGSSYIKYTPDNGVEVGGASIKVHASGGGDNIWEVNKQCQNIIGNKDGERIVIDGNSTNIKVYDDSNNNVLTIDGVHRESIGELFGDYPPTISIKNIPLSIQQGNLAAYGEVSHVFYTAGLFTIKCSISGGMLAQSITTGEVFIFVDNYSDAALTKYTGSTLVAHLESLEAWDWRIGGTYSAALNKGYHKISLLLNRNQAGGNVNFSINSFAAELIKSQYVSSYFANGLVLGTSTKNLISFINRNIGDKESFIASLTNEKFGISFDDNNLYAKRDGVSGILPSIICYGRAYCTSVNAGFDKCVSFDGKTPTIRRLQMGVVQITFPATWTALGITRSNTHVMLTGVGSAPESTTTYEAAIKATLYMWSSNGFTVVLSDDATKNDGEFYFELKRY